MNSSHERMLKGADSDSLAYALTLATVLSFFVAATSGEVVMPFLPHGWTGVANLATAVPVLAVAAWRRWQLFEACLMLVTRIRGR